MLPSSHSLKIARRNKQVKTIEMMEHSQPANQETPPNVKDTALSGKPYGTWSAETIKASGHVSRANRPNTRLLLTSCEIRSKMSCNAGAIHTGIFDGKMARQEACPHIVNRQPPLQTGDSGSAHMHMQRCFAQLHRVRAVLGVKDHHQIRLHKCKSIIQRFGFGPRTVNGDFDDRKWRRKTARARRLQGLFIIRFDQKENIESLSRIIEPSLTR